MKLADSLSGIVAICILLCQVTASFAQESDKANKPASDAVLLLAEKTLDAIRNKDADYVAALADPAGVYVGFDADKMTAAQFRSELKERKGVYCVIFDASCGKGPKMSTASSLRQLLVAQQVTTTAAKQDAQVVSVTVRKAAGPHEELFTLYFRNVGNHWRLQHIDYV